MNGELSKILYVEDEPDIQAIVKLTLEQIGGYTLEICSSGQEAIEKGAAFGPDLMLLDVMMPGLDGPTTLLELRQFASLKHTPAIFMTAKVQPQEISHYKEIGAIDVIVKPFDPTTLSATILGIWDSWLKTKVG